MMFSKAREGSDVTRSRNGWKTGNGLRRRKDDNKCKEEVDLGCG